MKQQQRRTSIWFKPKKGVRAGNSPVWQGEPKDDANYLEFEKEKDRPFNTVLAGQLRRKVKKGAITEAQADAIWKDNSY